MPLVQDSACTPAPPAVHNDTPRSTHARSNCANEFQYSHTFSLLVGSQSPDIASKSRGECRAYDDAHRAPTAYRQQGNGRVRLCAPRYRRGLKHRNDDGTRARHSPSLRDPSRTPDVIPAPDASLETERRRRSRALDVLDVHRDFLVEGVA
ncbi:hypothetical protein DFP72DRAFT_184435 [Ephemerocybe angulata]|uniref:Uncharacterized protein n=1 Tax=Ephemerocybe angulata TaxID=980116 RepID=A0A8H6H8J5_9AGAR|nr:hypothetical protein DFP72DRAFT_184435 [Tulosesus angulatus]